MNTNPVREICLTMSPAEAADQSFILKEIKKKTGIEVKSFQVIRRSVDARKSPVKINLGLLFSEDGEINFPFKEKQYLPIVEDASQIVIIGAGPAGLFAGLRAIEKGFKPIILERGKPVEERRKDIAKISREGKIDSESNYCFGEGGAGTFSDGKLYTRSKKRGNVKEVLEILHQFGASQDILISSHPHIGSDKLPGIIRNIREKIISCGGEIHFNTKMTDLLVEDGKAIGVRTQDGKEIFGPVFLATGHSARDTYRKLHEAGVKLEAKGLAIGVRLEHPQELIDKMQYHYKDGRGDFLPAAEYSFVNQAEGRGVYSFCMCPGGVIVSAISGQGQIVVNGMSASARSGKWANSGYVVELHPGDIKGFEVYGPFEMMALQEFLEKKFFEESGKSLNSPAQRIPDFIRGKKSSSLPNSSYAPGIHSSDFNNLLPKEIGERLKSGLQQIGRKCPTFVSEAGIMIGLESRTSSPVRIPRHPERMNHVIIEDLYPMGEGAGYAGGIVSSAIDGMNCIDSYAGRLINEEGIK